MRRVAGLAALALGCSHTVTPPGTPPAPLDCTAELSPLVQTVVNLSWTAPEGSRSYAELWDDAGYRARTWTVEGAAVRLPLVGVPADTVLHWRGVSQVDGGTSLCSGDTRTGTIPDDIPAFFVDVDAREPQSPEGFLLGAYYNLLAPRPYFVVMNRAGQVVWYAYGDPQTLSPDIQLAHLGGGLLYDRFAWTEGLSASEVRRIALDGTPLETLDTPEGHHMFAQLPDGGIAYNAGDAREITDPVTGAPATWHGDAIVERAPDGTRRTVFSVWDWMEPAPNGRSDDVSLYGGVDWTHGNALKYDATADTYLLSLGNPGDVWHIDRATGEPRAVWGADGLPADPVFDYPHDPTLLDDDTRLTMFMTDPATGLAGAIAYDVAPEGLTEAWRHGFDRASDYLGQVTRLANGNTFINFAARGELMEVTPAGEVVWQGSTGTNGTATGQFRWFSGFYDLPPG